MALDKNTSDILWKTYTTPIRNTPVPADVVPLEAEYDHKNRGSGPVDSYSGASIWGSDFAIDTKRNSLYFGTGQVHTIPLGNPGDFANGIQDTQTCETERRAAPGITDPNACISDKNFTAAAAAVDLDTGAVKWKTNLQGFDVWNVGCFAILQGPIYASFGFPVLPNGEDFCPTFVPSNPSEEPLGPGVWPLGPDGPFFNNDKDLAQAPMLVKGVKNVVTEDALGNITVVNKMDVLVAPTKAGFVHFLDPATGDLIRPSTQYGPGGLQGGFEFGSANDGETVYAIDGNTNILFDPFGVPFNPFPITGPSFYPGITHATGAIVFAIDVATGNIKWNTPVEAYHVSKPDGSGGTVVGANFAQSLGQITYSDGVVYVGINGDAPLFPTGSFGQGRLLAIDAETGEILQAFAPDETPGNNGGSAYARPTVTEGSIYWPTGASQFTGLFPNAFKLYAFDKKLAEDDDD